MNQQKMTWKEAWLASPGPRNKAEALKLYLTGLAMGTADIIPGVSGGTIALIAGIYEALLGAIQSFGAGSVKSLAQLRMKEALAGVHLRFLVVLLAGIATAILSIARLMNYLLKEHPVPTWALFLGLIGASIWLLGRQIKGIFGPGGVSFLAGTVLAWVVVGLIPVNTPDVWWFIILCGMIGICAMILPGLSGAFLLLILGKYEAITGALKNPFLPENLIMILLFCLGCLVGIMGFSRFLTWLLARWHNLTLAFLTGLMSGSLRKIWPWKEVVAAQEIRGKLHVISTQNVLPPALDGGFFLAVALAVVGALLILALDRKAAKVG